MKKNIIGILLLINVLANAQESIDCLTNIIKQNDIEYFSIINGDTIVQKKIDNVLRRKKADKKLSYVYINSEPIDSTGISFTSYPFLIGNELCFYQGKQDNIYGYSKKHGLNVIFEGISNLTHYKNYITTRLDSEILLITSTSGGSKKELNFQGLIDKEVKLGGDFESLESYYKINENEYALIKATCNISCWNYKLYKYDLIKKESKIIEWVSKGEETPGVKCGILMNNNKKTHFLTYIINSKDNDKNGEWILDENLKPISKTLSKHQIRFDGYNINLNKNYDFPKVAGIHYDNNRLNCYYLSVTLDNKNVVLIPFELNINLELSIYKAYNNSALTKEDIKGFGEYELGILRNLIFAKHNYDFSSEFYQAYFNLYAFYNAPEMRNARTKNVNENLTAADKTNLELIKGME